MSSALFGSSARASSKNLIEFKVSTELLAFTKVLSYILKVSQWNVIIYSLKSENDDDGNNNLGLGNI